MIIAACRDKTCVVLEPENGADRAFVAFENAICDPEVLPEREDLDVVFFVVARIHVTSMGKLDLSTSAHVVVLEFGFCHFILLQGVYHYSVKMPDNNEKARWVNRNGLDNIIEALDDLEVQISRVGRIVPYH